LQPGRSSISHGVVRLLLPFNVMLCYCVAYTVARFGRVVKRFGANNSQDIKERKATARVPTQPHIHPRLYYDTARVLTGKEMLGSSLISLVFTSFQFFGVIPNVAPVNSRLFVIAHHPFVKATEPERASTVNAGRFAVVEPGNSGEWFIGPNDSTQGWRIWHQSIQPQETMDMIRHDDKFVQRDAWKPFGQGVPCLLQMVCSWGISKIGSRVVAHTVTK
jgi:hypothetical protein